MPSQAHTRPSDWHDAPHSPGTALLPPRPGDKAAFKFLSALRTAFTPYVERATSGAGLGELDAEMQPTMMTLVVGRRGQP